MFFNIPYSCVDIQNVFIENKEFIKAMQSSKMYAKIKNINSEN